MASSMSQSMAMPWFALFILTSVSGTVYFRQIHPQEYSSACIGENVVFSCVSTTTSLTWNVPSFASLSYDNPNQVTNPPFNIGIFTIQNKPYNGSFISTATASNVMEANDGQSITCRDSPISGGDIVTLMIDVADRPPNAPANVYQDAFNNKTLRYSWDSTRCATEYSYVISHNKGIFEADNTTELSIDVSLEPDHEYTCSVAGIDAAGRKGNASQSEILNYTAPEVIGGSLENTSYTVLSSSDMHVNMLWMANDNSNKPTTFYNLTHNVSGKEETINNIRDTAATIRDVQYDTIYLVTVKPFNDAGAGISLNRTFSIPPIVKIVRENFISLIVTTEISISRQPVYTGVSRDGEEPAKGLAVFFGILSLVLAIVIVILILVIIRLCKKYEKCKRQSTIKVDNMASFSKEDL